jgi:hypothetical protein
LAALLAVILIGAGVGAYAQASAFSYAGLLAALRTRGAMVQESGSASSVLFRGAGHGLVVNGAAIAAYEYRTTLAAQIDVASLSHDGTTYRPSFGPFGGPAVTVDWIAPPHHYHRGRVIVTYIGSDVAIIHLLTSVLGPQFAGGAVPNGNGHLWLIERLRAAGATVDVARHMRNSPLVGGTQPTADEYDIGVNGAGLVVFEFVNDRAAATYASHIQGGDYVDLTTHQGIIIDYVAPPHFFRKFEVIALYIGSNKQVLQLLTSVLGPPFTEEHF